MLAHKWGAGAGRQLRQCRSNLPLASTQCHDVGPHKQASAGGQAGLDYLALGFANLHRAFNSAELNWAATPRIDIARHPWNAHGWQPLATLSP